MKKRIVLLLLLVFLSVTTFINFFHTEEVLQTKDTCPACHFQNSIPNLSPYDICSVCQPPELVALETLSDGEIERYQQVVLEHPSSRSPPPA